MIATDISKLTGQSVDSIIRSQNPTSQQQMKYLEFIPSSNDCSAETFMGRIRKLSFADLNHGIAIRPSF
jgi:hypothetical protein